MGTLAEDVATLNGKLVVLIDLSGALVPLDMDVVSPVSSLSALFGFVSMDPENLTQESANAIGYLSRAIDTASVANGDQGMIDAATDWHQTAAQVFVDHYPDLDWDQVAGTAAPSGMEAMAAATDEMASGPKHKPDPTVTE